MSVGNERSMKVPTRDCVPLRKTDGQDIPSAVEVDDDGRNEQQVAEWEYRIRLRLL